MIGCDIWLADKKQWESQKNQNAFCFMSFVFVLPYCFLFLLKIIYMYGCFAYTYVCVLCGCLVPAWARQDVRSRGTIVSDGCELPCGGWELKLGPLEEQPVLFISEPSLAHGNVFTVVCIPLLYTWVKSYKPTESVRFYSVGTVL